MEKLKDLIKKHPVLSYGYMCIVVFTILVSYTGKFGEDFLVESLGMFWILAIALFFIVMGFCIDDDF